MPAHRATRAVTRRAERARLRFHGSGEHVRASAHRAADQHRLTRFAQRFGNFTIARAESPRRAFAVHIELARSAVDAVLLDLASVVRDIIEQR